MTITRKDVTHPHTYQAEAGRFIAQRNDNFKETMLRVSMGHAGESVTFWLSDEEIDALATMLRDAHDTSKPLFPIELEAA